MNWVLVITLWTDPAVIHSIEGFKTEKLCRESGAYYMLDASLRNQMRQGERVQVADGRGELVKTICLEKE